jgi:acyl-coenzyme A thioesterase PaaI-like protein
MDSFMPARSPAIADSANGYAAYSLFSPGTDVLTVEFKINLVAPASAPCFVAQGRVVRPGRTLTVCLAHVYGVPGSDRVLIAMMLSTIVSRPSSGNSAESSG